VTDPHSRTYASRGARWRSWLGEELSEEWSEEWSIRRRHGIERRREEVRQILQAQAHLPGWLEDLLAECGEEFTPLQVEALTYRYGYGLSLSEAGDALGCSKWAFRKRLAGAEAKVSHLRGDVDAGIPADVLAEWGE